LLDLYFKVVVLSGYFNHLHSESKGVGLTRIVFGRVDLQPASAFLYNFLTHAQPVGHVRKIQILLAKLLQSYLCQARRVRNFLILNVNLDQLACSIESSDDFNKAIGGGF